MAITLAKLMVLVGADTAEADAGLKRVNSTLEGMGTIGKTALGMFGAQLARDAIVGIQGLGTEAVTAYADYERLGMSLQSLTAREMVSTGTARDMNEALAMSGDRSQELLKWTERLAIQSPFDQEGVSSAFRMAMAYGFSADQSQRLTQAMIDFSAGSGRGTADMNRIALALGQVKAAGKLTGQEMRQLTEAGLPVTQILADAFGVTTEKLIEMREKGLIPADKAIEAIVGSLEQDFGGAAARQATTFSGLITSLEDLKTIGLREFFAGTADVIQPELEGLVATLSDPTFQAQVREWGVAFGGFVLQVVDGVKQIVGWWGTLNSGTQQLIVTFGGLVVFGPSVVGMFSNIAAGGLQLIPVFKGLATGASTTMAAWNAGLSLTTSLSAGFGVLAVSLGAVAAAVIAVAAAWKMWDNTIGAGQRQVDAAAADRWSSMFDQMVADGANATQIAQAFTAENIRMGNAIDDVGGPLAVFVDKNKISMDGLAKANVAMARGAANYDEYAVAASAAAAAVGMRVDAEGNLVRTVQNGSYTYDEVIQRGYMMSEAMWNYTGTAEGAAEAQREANRALANYTVVADEAGAAASFAGDEQIATALELKDAMSLVTAGIKAQGIEGTKADRLYNQVAISMGAVTAEQVQLTTDTNLLTQAWAAGAIGTERYTMFMQQAVNGSLDLSDAQRATMQTAIDGAAAASTAAAAYRSLSEGLKGASNAQIAKTLMDQLAPLQQTDPQAYIQAVQDIQLAYNLATPQSIALGAGITSLTQAISTGIVPAENAAEALKFLQTDAKDGAINFDKVLAKFGTTPETAGQAAEALGTLASTTSSDVPTAFTTAGDALGTFDEKLKDFATWVKNNPILVTVTMTTPTLPTTGGTGGAPYIPPGSGYPGNEYENFTTNAFAPPGGGGDVINVYVTVADGDPAMVKTAAQSGAEAGLKENRRSRGQL